MTIDQTTIVTGKQLAACLNITDRQVRRLVKSGTLPSTDNQFPLFECVGLYVEYKTLAVSQDGDVIDFAYERARKTRADADRLERLNSIEQGEYIARSDVGHEISEAVGVCARILGNLKLNIARIAPQLPNRALDLIEKESAKAMTAICELDENYSQVDELTEQS